MSEITVYPIILKWAELWFYGFLTTIGPGRDDPKQVIPSHPRPWCPVADPPAPACLGDGEKIRQGEITRKTMGKPSENHAKNGKIIGKPWENHGNTIQSWPKSYKWNGTTPITSWWCFIIEFYTHLYLLRAITVGKCWLNHHKMMNK